MPCAVCADSQAHPQITGQGLNPIPHGSPGHLPHQPLSLPPKDSHQRAVPEGSAQRQGSGICLSPGLSRSVKNVVSSGSFSEHSEEAKPAAHIATGFLSLSLCLSLCALVMALKDRPVNENMIHHTCAQLQTQTHAAT